MSWVVVCSVAAFIVAGADFAFVVYRQNVKEKAAAREAAEPQHHAG